MEPIQKPSQDKKEVVQKGTSDFESRLMSVVEQDGVVMSTPLGFKKKIHKAKPAHKKSSFLYSIPSSTQSEDIAEKMDLESVACVVKRHEAPIAKAITINHRHHARSPFVVSLRDCFVPEEQVTEERSPVAEHLAYAQSLATPHKESYQALATSALKSKIYPTVRESQINKPHIATGALNFRLLANRLKLFWANIFSRTTKDLAILEKKEQALVAEAEQDFSEVATEVANERFSYAKATLGFVALVAIITLPAQALVAYRNLTQERNQVEQEGQNAVAALSDLASNPSLGVSEQKLQSASTKFRQADRLLDESRLLAVSAAAVVPKQYKSARSLLEVGNKMSQAGQLLAMGFGKVFDDPSRGLIERLEVLGTYARGALPLLTDAEHAVQTVDIASVPASQQDQARALAGKIRQAKESVREFAVLSDAMVNFLGKDSQRSYLLVFQNQTELRPSGGFMGSVAEIRIDQGKIVSLYVPKGGTYDLKGQLTARVIPPKPIQLINPLWQFQDANWFADFPKTAEKIRWFWSKSGQPTLDGVVAVNASFMEKVLQVTGPIEMPEYGKTITADNFLLETQKAVEVEYDKEANTPKKFIGDLFAKLMDKTKSLTSEQWLALASASSQALETKEIQISMFKPDEEQLVEDFGWQGRLKPTVGDSLAIVGANVAGQKTDAVVQESVKHVAEIQPNGGIIDTLRIQRTHQGTKGEIFRGVRNVQYLRVYVPKGSELLDAQGFEPPPASLFKQPLEGDGIDPQLAEIEKTAKSEKNTVWSAMEDDRTVFGGWLQLDPGKSQEIVLRYKLPFTVFDIMDKVQESDQSQDQQTRGAYLMLLTSQSGKPRTMVQQVVLSSPWQSLWNRDQSQPSTQTDPGSTGGQVQVATDGANLGWQGVLDRDQAVAVLLSANGDSHEQEK